MVEVAELKDQLSGLVEDVLGGRVNKGAATVANQLMNTRLRALEVERKIREQDEVLERLDTLEALEAMQQAEESTGSRRWGGA